MTRQRAYLLPAELCPSSRMDICISIPADLGHIMPFLAQLEYLANWYAWETDLDRSNVEVAACWRTIFNSVRESIDNNLGCGMSGEVKDIRLVDCVLEKQDFADEWSTVGSIAACVQAGIAAALADGTIPPSPYPVYPEPTTNSVNTTEADVACGIADFTSDYLIEKFNDQLDLIEALSEATVTVAKIAADVVSAVSGIGIVAGGAVDAVKDVVEGSISVTFAVIRASDTVEWRSDVKCILYGLLNDNGSSFGTSRDAVVTPFTDAVKALTPAISVLFGRWLDAIDISAFRRYGKIGENNEGECDDCGMWCYELDLTSPLPDWLTIEYGTQEADGIKSQSGLVPRTDTTGNAYVALAAFIVTMPVGGQITDVQVTADMHDSPTTADTRNFNTFYHGVLGSGAIDNTNEVKTLDSTPTSDFDTAETWKFRVGAGWSGSSGDFGYHTLTHLKMTGQNPNPFGDDNCA